MPGPVAWPLVRQAIVTGNQSIDGTTETIIATLSNVNSKGSGYQLNFSGFAAFAVQAATTATVLRIRAGTVTGTLIGSAVTASGGVATDLTAASGIVGGSQVLTGEIAHATYVLTIEATGADADWNTTYASLSLLQ